MNPPELKEGDWVHWLERPAIVIQQLGDRVEITVWVDAKECAYVHKH